MPLTAPKGPRHRTKQEFVYHAIRDAIMKCEMPPGERLVIDDLAARLAVSAIPVREALQGLQTEGLVVMVPHVGATVAPISHQSILEVFTVMEGLEIVGTRVAAERARPPDLEELEEVVAAMDRALGSGRHPHWANLNTRFHTTISRFAALPLLQEMTERVLSRWDRVRRYYFSGVLVHRVDQAQEEHHQILSAMQARDLARLEEVVRRHNQGALADYPGFLDRAG
jgi:DNA-binding GntR family transcriptional regulator